MKRPLIIAHRGAEKIKKFASQSSFGAENLKMRRPLIIAHRGASYDEKENTLEAFQLAVKEKADFIELDVRQTADKILVVAHNRGIKRGRKRHWIDKNTFSALEEIAGLGGILALETLFKKLGDKIGFFLDLKQAGMEKSLIGLVEKFGLKNVVFQANNGFTLLNIKKTFPAFSTVLYYEPDDRRDFCDHWLTRVILYSTAFILSLPIKKLLPKYFLGKVLTFRVDGVSLYYRFLNKKMVKIFASEGIKVFVWGIEKERQAKKVLACGVDGIITKRPDIAKKFLISNFRPAGWRREK